MTPLCSSCRSEAEFTTTGSSDTCSRCGEPCDNCGDVSPFDIPTSPGARTGGAAGMNIDWRDALATLLGIVLGVLAGHIAGGVLF